MTLSLDTNVLIEIVRGKRSSVREQFFRAQADETRMVASLVVFFELRAGCERYHDPEGALRRVARVLSRIPVEPFEEADMIMAARIRAELGERGLAIGPYDLLIAGQASARGWTVVTANTREFARIEGLNVIDWTAKPD